MAGTGNTRFDQAVQCVQSGGSGDSGPELSNTQKLQFYALYKQATGGPCSGPKPSAFDFVARAKYNAWQNLGDMSKDDAKRRYCELLEEIAPSWKAGQSGPSEPSVSRARQDTTSSAPVVSSAPTTSRVFRDDLFQGKVALITGGGSGICKEIARSFLEHGAKVLIASRSQEKITKAAAELSAATRGTCVGAVCDVRKPEQVEAAVDRCLGEFGRLDILINGAAGNFLAPAEKLSYNAYKTVVDIDTIGTFNMSKAAYTKWLKAHGGVIINVSMTLHYTGSPFQVHAGSAKAAIDSMTRHLAVEWGPQKVRVNAIAPGAVAGTEGFERLLPKSFRTKFEALVPLQRMAYASEIADGCLFLASDAASYVTGIILPVDGAAWMTTSGLSMSSLPKAKL